MACDGRMNILISEDTYLEASDTIQARLLGQATVKGRTGSVTVYELTAAERVESSASRPDTVN